MTQNIFFPEITINKLAADLTVGNTPQKVLFVGQQSSGATASGGSLITEIANDNSWDTLFSNKSMIAGGIRAFRDINTETRVDAIPLDDAIGILLTSGLITTINIAGFVSNFQSVEEGILAINIDDAGFNDISGLDFTSITDLIDVASILNSAISGVTVTGTATTITFTSDTTGSSSKIAIVAATEAPATAGTFTTPDISGNLSNFLTESIGALAINIDGAGFNDITLLDFTSETTLAGVASVLDAAISGVTITESSNTIIFTSDTTGSSSSIVLAAPGSGNDITGSTFLNIASGVQVDGIAAENNIEGGSFLATANPGTIKVDGVDAEIPATSIVDFTSSLSTEVGTLTVSVASLLDYAFGISIVSGESATAIGDTFEALVNASTNAPFSAANIAGVVTLTAENKGTEANTFGLNVSGAVAGVTIALTAWSGGITNPTLTDVFDVIGDTRYQTIVWAGAYDLTELQDLLDGRFNAEGQILDGVGITATTQSLSTAKIVALALNSQSLVLETNPTVSTSTLEGGVILELDYVRASQLAAARSLRLTEGANITNLTVTNAPKDQIGGPSIATLPYANTPFPNLPIIPTGLGFTQSQIKELNTAGGIVFGNNLNNTGIILGQVVTTYKTDAVGNPDQSFKFLNFVDTLSNVAEYFFNNLRNDLKSSRLTLGDLKDGFSMENKKSLTAQLIKYYQDLTGPVFLLLQDGEDARRFFIKHLTLDVDLLTGTVDFSAKVPIITQIRVITGNIQIAFDLNDILIAA